MLSASRMAKAKEAKTHECKQIQAKLASLNAALAETEKDLAIKRAAFKKDLPFLSDATKAGMQIQISDLAKRLEAMRQKSTVLSEKVRLCQDDISKIAKGQKVLRSEVAARQNLGECIRFVPKRSSSIQP